MSFIKVPIGRGIISQIQEKPQTGIRVQSDIQFLQQLADEGRLVSASGSANASGTVTSLEVPNGTSFYMIETSFSYVVQAGGAPSTLDLINLGDIVDSIQITNSAANITGKFGIRYDVLHGNGLTGDGNNYRIDFTEGVSANVNVSATIFGYFLSTTSTRSRSLP